MKRMDTDVRALAHPVALFGFTAYSRLRFVSWHPRRGNFLQARALYLCSNTTDRVVIGFLADVSARYENGKPITVIHMLEFSTDLFLQEPTLLELRLCGDQRSTLEAVLHTNITLVYRLASQSRLTGCHDSLSSEPWQDGSKWETVTFTPKTIKRSPHLDKFFQNIMYGTSPN